MEANLNKTYRLNPKFKYLIHKLATGKEVMACDAADSTVSPPVQKDAQVNGGITEDHERIIKALEDVGIIIRADELTALKKSGESK